MSTRELVLGTHPGALLVRLVRNDGASLAATLVDETGQTVDWTGVPRLEFTASPSRGAAAVGFDADVAGPVAMWSLSTAQVEDIATKTAGRSSGVPSTLARVVLPDEADGRVAYAGKVEWKDAWSAGREVQRVTFTLMGQKGDKGDKGDKGETGDTGPANTLSIGAVTTGAPGSLAEAAVTGEAPAQTLDLIIPRGDKGETGDTGPVNVLSIGTVTTGAPGSLAEAAVTGVAPVQTLDLTIPRGDKGDKGDTGDTGDTGATGPANALAIGAVTTGAAGTPASATINGAAPNQSLDLTIPKGDPGGFVASSLYSGDLNALVTPGLYNTATGLANAPTTASGGHVAVYAQGTYVRQEWRGRESATNSNIYSRISANSGTSWSAWAQVDIVGSSSVGYTADFNAALTAGNYWVSTANSTSVKNSPTPGVGGFLQVQNSGGGSLLQRWTNHNGAVWIRTSVNSGTSWSTWVKAATDVMRGGAGTTDMIDVRGPMFTTGANTKTGAIMIPVRVTGPTMLSIEVDIFNYNSSLARHTLIATAYLNGTTGVYNSRARLESGAEAQAAMGPLAVPKVRWFYGTGVANTVYLLIGDIDSSWNVANVEVKRTLVTYTSDQYLGTDAPTYVTALPAGTGVTSPVLTSGGVIYGTGSPEGVVIASPSAKYIDWAGTNGAYEWVKASGIGTPTGWKVSYGDTGWRDVTALADATRWNNVKATLNFVLLRRINDTVQVSARLTRTGTLGGGRAGAVDGYVMDLPTEFRSTYYVLHSFLTPSGESINRTPSSVGAISLHGGSGNWTLNDKVEMHATYMTSAAWPSTLPGVAG